MFPMPTPQMPPVGPGASMLTRGMLQRGAGQLGQIPLQQGVIGQSGGLLSKLFGGAQAGGGGFTNILNMLQNAQKAIGVFQQVSPMVQQYAPFVKSLPSLISMMRNSGNSEDANQEVAETIPIQEEEESNEIKATKKKKSSPKSTASSKVRKGTKNRKSVQPKQRKRKSNYKNNISKELPAPKLYI